MYRQLYLIRCGEVALKGENKPYFERMLAERIKKVLKPIGQFEVMRSDGLILVYGDGSQVISALHKVVGVDSISPAIEVKSEVGEITKAAAMYVLDLMKTREIHTFKAEVKRADKEFPMESPQLAREVGASVLIAAKTLKVDVHNPDLKLYVHVRRGSTFIYHEKISGFGGLPLGTNGKGLILLSGGIDSPVAAFMMSKRGMRLEAMHFHSYPYTSERAFEKVKELAEILAVYCGPIRMHSVNLLPIQEQIVSHCPEPETTVHVRRFMMMIAQKIAEKNGCQMLITGESLGQVASQTSDALVTTDAAVSMPVMRPLIALDKSDIIRIAQDIGTFEKSIEPYEDCCTVFLPKHPTTKPKLENILKSEAALDCETLVRAAVEREEIIDIR